MKIAIIPGDGIGPEVVREGQKVLTAAVDSNSFDFIEYDLGADRWLRTGEVLPDSVLSELKQVDAIILGAVGADPNSTKIPSGLLERGLLLKLRFALDHSVNLRPAKYYPGVTTPLAADVIARGDIDFVVVREGTEGLYCGNGGIIRQGTPQEIATEVSVNTAHGVARVVRDAFTRAQNRRGKLTLVHKHNVLVNAGSLWQRTVARIAPEFPEVSVDYLHVDASMIMMVQDPGRFDVIVTDNLFGDIITDLSGAITGGIGLAASANINVERKYPSMFEPVHGSAPDIAGKGIANPTATISSMALLLDHLGLPKAARKIEEAVAQDLQKNLGKNRRTSEIGDAIAKLL